LNATFKLLDKKLHPEKSRFLGVKLPDVCVHLQTTMNIVREVANSMLAGSGKALMIIRKVS